MAFYGVFIGIDKYCDPRAQELTAARRDATALWALFIDTIPQMDAQLLCNEHATKEKISSALSRSLEDATQEDAVVIFFSGHGSRDHRLICFDTMKETLADTTISMDLLADAFKHSKAKVILLVLDCCFSGKAPARVMEDTPAARDGSFSWEKLAGKGRIIISASAANEVALETPGGHGLLSAAILHAMQSGQETVDLFGVMGQITGMVRADALKMGHTQNPVVFGFLEEGLILPVLKKGQKFYEVFPELKGHRVTSSVRDLSYFGFPAQVLDEWEKNFKNGLNNLQQSAVNDHRILDGDSLLVVAPTSSGKTFIGEMASIRTVIQGKKAVFIFPYKALVNEKYDQFSELYGDRLGIRVIRCDGDHGEQVGLFMKGKYDIALFTFETFLALSVANPFVLNQIGLIVLDEAQFIADPTRGISVELLLTYLISIRERNIKPQLIALSAVIGNVNNFDNWLDIHNLITKDRPVPLTEGVLDRQGRFQYLDVDGQQQLSQFMPAQTIMQRGDKPSVQDVVVPFVKKLIHDNPSEKIIVFRNVRGKAEGCAKYLANDLGLPAATDVESELPNNDLSRSSSSLREALRGGTAFHNANLTPREKMVIERAFRDAQSRVRVLGATTTVAAGINTPASTVILAEKEFIGEDGREFTIAEYKNMAGRSGRLGYNEIGRSVILADNDTEREMLFRKYVLGTPESITSSFHTDEIETWFVRLLAQFSRVLQEDAVKLLSCTFAGYLKNKMSPGWQEHIRVSLEKFLLKMVELKLVEQENGYVQLTLLGRACGRSHLKFRSAMRLVELLRSLSATSFTAMGIIAVIQGLDEMDQQARISIFRKGSKEDIWPHNASRLFGREVILLLQNHVPKDIYDYYARSKKALLLYDWISGMSVHDLESKYTLVDNSFCRLTYGHLINIANMTRFHLKSASEIASLILLGNQSIGDEIDRLLIRLEIGLPEELLGLLELPIKLDRGHYLALFNVGIRNKEQFWKASPDTLELIIGKRLIGQLNKYRQTIN